MRRQTSRAGVLESERQLSSPGTCTFFGTANSNRMMMEMMGLHMQLCLQPG
jgi:dihydroxyacid dehydratase/phosphogluconate dehydratase